MELVFQQAKFDQEKDLERFKAIYKSLDSLKGLGYDRCDVCGERGKCVVNIQNLRTKCILCFAKEKFENGTFEENYHSEESIRGTSEEARKYDFGGDTPSPIFDDQI